MLKRPLKTLCVPLRSKGGDVLRGTVADVRLSFFFRFCIYFAGINVQCVVDRSIMKFVCEKYMFETNNPYNETFNNFAMSRERNLMS